MRALSDSYAIPQVCVPEQIQNGGLGRAWSALSKHFKGFTLISAQVSFWTAKVLLRELCSTEAFCLQKLPSHHLSQQGGTGVLVATATCLMYYAFTPLCPHSIVTKGKYTGNEGTLSFNVGFIGWFHSYPHLPYYHIDTVIHIVGDLPLEPMNFIFVLL